MSAAGRRVGSRPVDRSLPRVPLRAVVAATRAELRGDESVLVADASYDSRDVPHGSLFFCVRGENVDGHDFVGQAVASGAAALVVERPVDVDVPQLIVRSVRAAMGPASATVFGEPASAMTTVGVTGTNGKTTVTYLLEAVFRSAGVRPGVIGTTGARLDGAPISLAHTTPEAPDLHRLLTQMKAKGIRAVAMEVSSHALAQHRVGGLVLDMAVFTNLSQDHLDFHGTMDEYFAAKASLFTPSLARRGVVNADDAWGRRLADDGVIPIETFAVDHDADLVAHDVVSDASGVAFTAGGVTVRSRLRGGFNVWNCLAAMAVARALGMDLHGAAEAIAELPGVPGRMEPVEAGQDFLVVVDYAHTPDSILSVLRGARPLSAGRVIAVFGCGGDRDHAKRPLMGQAATSSADLTFITSDNPRSEDPRAIIEQVLPGARAGGGDFRVELDRRAAILEAVRSARPGDVVVIAGKGHETHQEIGDERVPFDDRVVASEAISARQETGR